jgi:hypothetical protein
MSNLSYTEAMTYSDYRDRFEYLRLSGSLGEETFGIDRYLNQRFYRSSIWRQLRNHIIVRDHGCDMAHPDYEVPGKIIIHHINPIDMDDILYGSAKLTDPDNLIAVSHRTHNAIHFGDNNLLAEEYEPRRPGDTKLW